MIEDREKAVDYFRSREEFGRCFQEMRKKWKSYGRITGKIVLKNCSEKERLALGNFLGVVFHEADISFNMSSFEAALRETRFGNLPLKELMELYFEEKLISNAESKNQEAEAWNSFCNRCRNQSCDWMESIQNKNAYGYKLVYKVWKQSEDDAYKLAVTVNAAIHRLQCLKELNEGILLAVLAAEVSGNPHYLDRGTIAGQLLTCILSWQTGTVFPENSEALAELYLDCGILLDDISNTVAAFGLHIEKNGKLHPAYEGFFKEKEAFVLTGKNLEQVSRVYGECPAAFVVENEMVFSHLCRQCSGIPVTILCTSGQPRKAAWRMLQMLAAEKIPIYYSGDLDPEGMDIAERIWKRYPEWIHIWRMDRAAYMSSRSEEIISKRRLAMMDRLENPTLMETADMIRVHKTAGYQEALLNDMIFDIQKVFCD